MEGKLTWIYMPVSDLKPALKFYRDQLGLEESWREGDTTVAFKLPDTDVELMIDVIRSDTPYAPGPAFYVESADHIYAEKQGMMEFVGEPIDIPGGRWLAAKDLDGNGLYFMDQSTAEPGTT